MLYHHSPWYVYDGVMTMTSATPPTPVPACAHAVRLYMIYGKFAALPHMAAVTSCTVD